MVCGCPRSGTTWLHNQLIACGRFKGVEADDMGGPDTYWPFFTDENRYVQLLCLHMHTDRGITARRLSRGLLRIALAILYLRFGRRGQYLLKSPYYCFVADSFRQMGVLDKLVYMRRDLDLVSLSMLKHPHISRLLNSDWNNFFDMNRHFVNLETRHVSAELVRYVADNYERLSLFDRALFKCLCFSSAFAGVMPSMDADSIFIFDHRQFAEEAEHREAFAEFVSLTRRERGEIEASYKPAAVPSALPAHDPGLRKQIIELERSFWSSGRSLMPGNLS